VTGREEPAISGTVDEVAGQLRLYEEAGVERVMLQHIAHEDVDMVAVLGRVAAQLG
jgi:alkanesulfonate monooxygenase SsuD/methylene tetrahydromethanopterin reductase-like flavin-dependent oxidoreductase (luciferase family)